MSLLVESDFQKTVLEYYKNNKRNLPWRAPVLNGRMDPYQIMVSEVMLQQTQAARVVNKYNQFLKAFPTIDALAEASLGDVLLQWQGLGYNRRAKYLRDAAIEVVQNYEGKLPTTVEGLKKLPGIGVNTAAAIVAYAYNEPVAFVETNIRAVYIYHFFADHDEKVSDKQILEAVERTLLRDNPREWYWALMDYGTYIKKQFGSHNDRSKHYVKQSVFHGSTRQIRGQVLRELSRKPQTVDALKEVISDNRLQAVLEDLLQEQLVKCESGIYQIAD